MSVNFMVEGWNECDDIAVNAPSVGMSSSSVAQVFYAAGVQGMDSEGDTIPADRVGAVIELFQKLDKSLVGTSQDTLRARGVVIWTVLAFAQSRQRGVYWA